MFKRCRTRCSLTSRRTSKTSGRFLNTTQASRSRLFFSRSYRVNLCSQAEAQYGPDSGRGGTHQAGPREGAGPRGPGARALLRRKHHHQDRRCPVSGNVLCGDSFRSCVTSNHTDVFWHLLLSQGNNPEHRRRKMVS